MTIDNVNSNASFPPNASNRTPGVFVVINDDLVVDAQHQRPDCQRDASTVHTRLLRLSLYVLILIPFGVSRPSQDPVLDV